MREELTIGQAVLHNGTEKVINEIHGDVLILNDGSVVNPSYISIIQGATQPTENHQEDEHLAGMRQSEKDALRDAIEGLNEESIAVAVFALTQEVDPTMTIRAMENNTVESIKKILLHKAVASGKIDPKICSECGQRVPE